MKYVFLSSDKKKSLILRIQNTYKMKRYLFPAFVLMVILSGCKTSAKIEQTSSVQAISQPPVDEKVNAERKYHDQSTWILGYFNADRLASSIHSEWFIPGKDGYLPNSESMNKLLEIVKDPVTIKIVMGTWCPDSRREVPRFMRIMDIWQFPYSKITFIGVDNEKRSPVGEFEQLDIQRVPTFIVYKNNIEAGRIIENPSTSLEQDMVNILTRNEK
jgi:thiol-disulfide isomerase/thioredoxin